MIKALFNVEASRQSVYSILTDYASYAKWIPGCERCAILSASGNVTDTHIVINSMKRMELQLRFEAEPLQSLRFRMTKGKDLKGYSGTYRLMSATDQKGTVIIAELEIDAGFMAPKFMVDRVAAKALQDTGQALQKYLSSGDAGRVSAIAVKQADKESKPRRNKSILRVVQTSSGYNIRLFGETLAVKARAK
jgi:carbon monoxide dehydrogenase subunit G